MIRLAEVSDIPALLAIFDKARSYMRAQGNSTQWVGGYPDEKTLRSDIASSNLYVMEEGGRSYGAFAFIIGEDPAYKRIDGGSWSSDEPYGTIHRIGSDGSRKGVFDECVEYCKGRIGHLRIDTHELNGTMRHLILRAGFVHAGTIYVGDGSPRLAFEWLKERADY